MTTKKRFQIKAIYEPPVAVSFNMEIEQNVLLNASGNIQELDMQGDVW